MEGRCERCAAEISDRALLEGLLGGVALLCRELTGRELTYRLTDTDGGEVLWIGPGTLAHLTSEEAEARLAGHSESSSTCYPSSPEQIAS